jgi:hypothetical protein
MRKCAVAFKEMLPQATSHQRLNRHPQPRRSVAVIQVRLNPKDTCKENKLEQSNFVLEVLVYSLQERYTLPSTRAFHFGDVTFITGEFPK